MGVKGSGRRPLPTAVKALRGFPGHRAGRPDEPQPATGEPPMPKGSSAAAVEEWRRIVPELLALGVLTVLDGKALAAYGHCWARFQEAEAEIERLGIMLDEPVTDKDGN